MRLQTHRVRVFRAVIFYSLIGLAVLVAVPYGSVEPWWRALFESLMFVLAAVSFIEVFLTGEPNQSRYAPLLPLLALAAFGFIQTIPFGATYSAGLARNLPRTISYDAHTTRLWVVEMLALVLLAAMLLRNTTTEKRFRALVYCVIGVAVASAIFGLVRQTMQHQPGFGLPYLQPKLGYAQFINRNHFAFLAEMGLGLALGLVIWRGLPRERLVLLAGAILILAGATVLANSRGGLLAILCQVFFAGVLRSVVPPKRGRAKQDSRYDELVQKLAGSKLVRASAVVILLAAIGLGTIWIGGAPLVASLEAVPTEVGAPVDNMRWAVRRWDIWPATLKMIKDHPIVGVGFGGFWMAISRYHNASGEMVPQEAHNDYLEFLASGGVIAAVCAVSFLLLFIRRVRTQLDDSSGRFVRACRCGALVGLAGVAIHSLVDFGLHIPANAAMFFVLLVIAMVDLPPKQRPSSTI